MLQLATAVECPHQLKPSNRHTSCPGSRAGAPVCQRTNPAVAVVRYLWCRAVGFIRAAVGSVCAVRLSCAVCVLAMWLQVGLSQARTTSKPHFSSKKNTKYSEGVNSHLRDILVCADHAWRKYPNSPGSSKTPDAHNLALYDQYRDISEIWISLPKEKKNAKKFKIVLAEKPIWRKQLKSQETTGKTSRNKNNEGRARNQRKTGPFRK